MLRRYNGSVVSSSPIVVSGVHFGASLTINSTTSQETDQTFIIGGTPGATITVQLTSLGLGEADFYVDAFGGNMSVGNTFTKVLDASGNANFTSILAVSNQPGRNSATAVLTITNASSGSIANPSTQSFNHTTPL